MSSSHLLFLPLLPPLRFSTFSLSSLVPLVVLPLFALTIGYKASHRETIASTRSRSVCCSRERESVPSSAARPFQTLRSVAPRILISTTPRGRKRARARRNVLCSVRGNCSRRRTETNNTLYTHPFSLSLALASAYIARPRDAEVSISV